MLFRSRHKDGQQRGEACHDHPFSFLLVAHSYEKTMGNSYLVVLDMRLVEGKELPCLLWIHHLISSPFSRLCCWGMRWRRRTSFFGGNIQYNQIVVFIDYLKHLDSPLHYFFGCHSHHSMSNTAFFTLVFVAWLVSRIFCCLGCLAPFHTNPKGRRLSQSLYQSGMVKTPAY